MKDFKFTVAFLLPAKAEKTKNFKELLRYGDAMGFQSRLSRCLDNSKILFRVGKPACTPLEVANLLIALHLLATQRKEDVVIVGMIDGVKYQHRLFATLSIEKIRNWSEHLSSRLATRDPRARSQAAELPPAPERRDSEASSTEEKAPIVVIPNTAEPRVWH